MTTWSMTEARQRFRELLDRADRGDVTEITRRGETAAVVISAREYDRLRERRPDFAQLLHEFRESIDPADLLTDDEFNDLRDHRPGRPVDLS